MEIIWFAIFFLAGHFFAMLIFSLTTYHKYFLPVLPLLLLYSAALGWALYKLGLHAFFLPWVAITSFLLFRSSRRNAKQGEAMLHTFGDDADMVRFFAKSIGKTKQFFAYSSFIYIITFSVAFLFLYNNTN